MASRIEQIIDEIEDYIDGCKTQAFAPSKIIVNRETMEELLNELRRSSVIRRLSAIKKQS